MKNILNAYHIAGRYVIHLHTHAHTHTRICTSHNFEQCSLLLNWDLPSHISCVCVCASVCSWMPLHSAMTRDELQFIALRPMLLPMHTLPLCSSLQHCLSCFCCTYFNWNISFAWPKKKTPTERAQIHIQQAAERPTEKKLPRILLQIISNNGLLTTNGCVCLYGNNLPFYFYLYHSFSCP